MEHQRKPRVLITASTFPRWEGDTEPRFILDLAKAYQPYFDVTVLAPAAPGAKNEEVIEGVSILRYHYFPVHAWETLCYPGAIMPRIKEKKRRVLLVPFLFAGLWSALLRILPQYEAVHAHWLIPQGIVQGLFRKKYILTGHGSDVASLNGISLIRKLKIRAIRRADAFAVVSNTLADYAEEHFSVPRPRIISMGFDAALFSPKYRVDEFFGQEGKPVVLFVGRLEEIKGVTYLIQAVEDLDVKLVIVGKGQLEQELKEQARHLGDKVVFFGAKTHAELQAIYASADVFVAPSITAENGGKEGLGLVLLEAMASGLAVIGSDSGGISEVIENGRNGLLVPEKDAEALSEAIQILISDDDQRVQLTKNALNDVMKRDYKVIASNYADLINKALQ